MTEILLIGQKSYGIQLLANNDLKRSSNSTKAHISKPLKNHHLKDLKKKMHQNAEPLPLVFPSNTSLASLILDAR